MRSRRGWGTLWALVWLTGAVAGLEAQGYDDPGRYADPDAERLQIYARWDALAQAAADGELELVESLLPSFTSGDLNNNTQPAIVAAARNGHEAVVLLLLEAGALVDQPDYALVTALMAAAQAGEADMVGLLLDKGANPLLRDEQGRTAEDLARGSGHPAIADRIRAATRR